MAKKKSRRDEYEDDEDDDLDDDDLEIEDDDEEEEEEEEEERLDEPDLPAAVMIASLLWTITGGLTLAGFFVGLIFYLVQLGEVADPNQRPQLAADPAWATAQVVITLVVAVFGAVFLMVGIQTLQGTAKDTTGNGFGSIGFGLAYVAFGVVTGLSAAKYATILCAVEVLLGFGLAFGGLLALVSQKQYVAFAKYQERKKKMKRKRRRRS